jgi:hypothetical protein
MRTVFPIFTFPSPASGGRSVGIVHLRTHATEFFLCAEALRDPIELELHAIKRVEV